MCRIRRHTHERKSLDCLGNLSETNCFFIYFIYDLRPRTRLLSAHPQTEKDFIHTIHSHPMLTFACGGISEIFGFKFDNNKKNETI